MRFDYAPSTKSKQICEFLSESCVRYVIRFLRPLTAWLVAFVSTISSFAIDAATWTQYQGNAANTGYVAARGVPSSNEPTWSFETESLLDPTPALQFAPGIASDGQSVFLSWIGQLPGVNGINSLDISTGVEQWEWLFTGNDSQRISQPAYNDGKVYVHRWGDFTSCGIHCPDKPRLLGIDSNTGDQLFDQVYRGQWASGGAPTAEGGNVFFAGGLHGGLNNYDGNTGVREWSWYTPNKYGWVPAVNGEQVFASFGGNLTVANRSKSGAHNIAAPRGAGFNYSPVIPANPVIAGPHEVYAAANRTVTQFDPVNGYPTWDYQRTSGVIWQGLAIGKTSLYVNFDNSLVALDRATGDEFWVASVPIGRFVSNLVLTDTHLFVANQNTTFAYNLQNQQIQWDAPYSGALAITGDHLFISSSQELHAFSLQGAPVPEPASVFYAALATGVMLVCCRRRTILLQ